MFHVLAWHAVRDTSSATARNLSVPDVSGQIGSVSMLKVIEVAREGEESL